MFLVCGEALYDVFLGDEDDNGFKLDARLGGSAFNCAIGIARLSGAVSFLTGVSTDALGSKIKSALDREGVGTAFLARPARPTTLALVALGADGGANYTFYGDGAADRAVTVADLPSLDGIQGLVFGCFSMLTEPTGSSFLELARRAAGRALVVVDPNIRTTVEPDLDRWRERVAAFVHRADIVKVSAEDLAALYPGLPAEAVAGNWLEVGCKLVVVTDGGAGARAWFRNGSAVVAAPKIKVVDTVGAGDSFLAALLVQLASTGLAHGPALQTTTADEVEAALTFAAAAAAHTCGRRGADLPRRADLAR